MSAAWKTVRVFISSTFRDMQAERDHLVRFVFPKLRQELLPRRIHLVDVDLRWGVTSEQDALSVCREVIDQCRPRFLCILGGRYGWVPPGKSRSITADEVHYGVLHGDLKRPGSAYFYFRDPSATAAMVEVTPGEFREPDGTHGAASLGKLKAAIVEAGLRPFIYRAQWDEQSRRLIELKEFGDRVYADLKQCIDQEFGTATGEKPDEFTEENAAMEAFMEEHVQGFVLGSRQPIWNELLQHAHSTEGNSFLCLIGEPGSGKSALMSYLAGHPALRADSLILICHFIGASPASTDLRYTLRRLCRELKSACAEISAEIPDRPSALRDTYLAFLRQASVHRRVVLLLDGVNQFTSDSDDMTHLLPERLPSNVRIIFSTDRASSKEFQDRLHPPRLLKLEPLNRIDGRAIIDQFQRRYHKELAPEQREALLAKRDAGKPLYLTAALEELRTMGSYEHINQRIDELPPKARALFKWVLRRLEADEGFRDASGRQIGQELVTRFGALLGSSRSGLSQRELIELLDPEDPHGNVAALLHLLHPFLMRRGELVDFYQRDLLKAVRERFLSGKRRRIAAHAQLADYFRKADVASPRRLWELAYQLDQAGMKADLAQLHQNDAHVQAKLERSLADDDLMELLFEMARSGRTFSSTEIGLRVLRMKKMHPGKEG